LVGTARDLFGQEMVAPRWRTTSQGVAIIGLALGWAIAGIVGGYLIKEIGFGATFLVGVVSALFAAGMLVGFLRRDAPSLREADHAAA
jgi:predicted MFS family arabinose efflux permease